MDLKKMMGGLSNSGALSGFMGGVAGGGLTSMIASKKGRKVGKSALKIGGLAAVGGLAWKAYQNYSAKSQGGQQAPEQAHHQGQALGNSFSQQAAQPSTQQVAQFDFAPARIQQQQFEEVIEDSNPNGQMLLMRAMIAAAHSDGHIDDSERQRIFAQVETMELTVEEKSTLFDELKKPLDLTSLVSQVPNAQTGIEVYAASATALDLQQQDSQDYLQALANQLCIPTDLTVSIQQQIQAY